MDSQGGPWEPEDRSVRRLHLVPMLCVGMQTVLTVTRNAESGGCRNIGMDSDGGPWESEGNCTLVSAASRSHALLGNAGDAEKSFVLWGGC